MQQASIPKQIKKRQSHACDFCRKSKKRCDGKSPCFRCIQRSKICIYSENKRTKSKRKTINTTKQNKLQLQQVDGVLGAKALNKAYFDNYFHSINPIQIFNKNVSIDKYLSNPTDKSVLLQYNAILASATRSYCNNQDIYLSFEGKAKQLAGELLDDFSIDTAIGFELLTFHYWGEDIFKMNHYRDITLSLCKRIVQIGCNGPNDYDEIMRIHLGTAGMVDINQQTDELGKALDKYSSLLKQLPDINLNNNDSSSIQKSSLNTKELLLWATARTRLSQLLFKHHDDALHEDPTKNPFNIITQTEVEEIKAIMLKMHKIMTQYFPPKVFSIARNATVLLHAFLLYAMNDKMGSIALIETAVTSSESLSYLLCACGPYFISFFHFAFKIAFLEKHYTLANRISGLQRKLAEVMPVAKQVMEIDMSLLRSIANSPSTVPFSSCNPLIESQNTEKLGNDNISNIYNINGDGLDIFQFDKSTPSPTFIPNITDNITNQDSNIFNMDNNTSNHSPTISNLFNNIPIWNNNNNTTTPQLNTTHINTSDIFNFNSQISNDMLNIEDLNPLFLDNLINELQ